MKFEKYKMSFTTGGLFYRESVKIAELYTALSEWSDVREQVIEENLLQVQTVNSSKRISREIISRLKCLTEDEMKLLVNGSRQDQIQILWVSICRKYKFIHDFVINVLREKYLRLNMILTTDDYNIFFNAKAQWHEELASLSRSTQAKLIEHLKIILPKFIHATRKSFFDKLTIWFTQRLRQK